MTPHRGWYVAGLVAAVMALLLSVGAVAAVMTRGIQWNTRAASSESWRQGLAGNGMMGDRGMMGGWDDNGGRVAAEQATATAQAWVDAHEPGASLNKAVTMPMGYLFTVTKGGQVIGTIMVNDDTGQLVWRGALPSPTTSAS